MRKLLRSLLTTLILACMAQAGCVAQSRYQLFAGYSLLSNSINGVAGSHQPLNGWDASFAFPPWRGLRFKVDTTAYRGTNLNAPQHLLFIMGGAEYSHRFGPERLYVEGLGGTGGANRNWAANQTPGQTASFAAFLGGGVDTPISKRFAWRVDGGYQYSYFQLIQSLATLIPVYNTNLPTNFGRISTGLVWQF
jgi:hypothetical protein